MLRRDAVRLVRSTITPQIPLVNRLLYIIEIIHHVTNITITSIYKYKAFFRFFERYKYCGYEAGIIQQQPSSNVGHCGHLSRNDGAVNYIICM
jgi:hypothetical protein